MPAADIISLIGSLGFPIVCCMAMFWYINKTMKDFSEKMEASIDRLTTSLQSNTDATSQLVTTVELLAKIGGEQNED